MLKVKGELSMGSNNQKPSKYPITPPKTDATVAKLAKRHALLGCASDIGASITSGGTGKKTDSAKLMAAK